MRHGPLCHLQTHIDSNEKGWAVQVSDIFLRIETFQLRFWFNIFGTHIQMLSTS